MDWLIDNWAEITAAVLVAVRVVESIIQATAMDKDDKIWEKVKKVIGLFLTLS